MMFSERFEHSNPFNGATNEKISVNLGLHLRPCPQLGESMVQPYRGNPLCHSGFSVEIQHVCAPPTGSCETWGTLEPNSNEGIAVGDPLNRFLMFSDPGTHPTPKTYNFEKNQTFFENFRWKNQKFRKSKFSTKKNLADFFLYFFFVEKKSIFFGSTEKNIFFRSWNFLGV